MVWFDPLYLTLTAPASRGNSAGSWLPRIDEFVKTLGDFKGVEDFKQKLHENMLKEKEASGAGKAHGHH